MFGILSCLFVLGDTQDRPKPRFVLLGLVVMVSSFINFRLINVLYLKLYASHLLLQLGVELQYKNTNFMIAIFKCYDSYAVETLK